MSERIKKRRIAMENAYERLEELQMELRDKCGHERVDIFTRGGPGAHIITYDCPDCHEYSHIPFGSAVKSD